MQEHEFAHMLHHAMHVGGDMLCRVECCKSLKDLALNSNSLADVSPNLFRFYAQSRIYLQKLLPKLLDASGFICLAKSCWDGPVSVLHFSFFDSRPIQKEYPEIPISFTTFSKEAIWVSLLRSRECSLLTWSMRSSCLSFVMKRSISVSATLKNIWILSKIRITYWPL